MNYFMQQLLLLQIGSKDQLLSRKGRQVQRKQNVSEKSEAVLQGIESRRKRCDDDQPDAEESKKFGGDIWSESVDHNREAKWLKDLQRKINVTRQEKVDITKESLKKIFGGMPN